MIMRVDILKLLRDGGFHSGTDMGVVLGVSRAAVCKTIKSLTALGLEIHRVPGRGYRLLAAFAPLDKPTILRQLSDSTYPPEALTVLDEVDSTNSYLLNQAQHQLSGRVCVAEAQTSGRGRRGRRWQATPYHNILFSMAWRFEQGPAFAAGLSLAAGVAVVRALREIGVLNAGLKWPNDILVDGRKLAGLLVEMRGEATGPSLVVLGLGLNVYLAKQDAQAIDQPWIDLHTLLGRHVDRNYLVAVLIRQVQDMFTAYAQSGWQGFQEEWAAYHLYNRQRVRLQQTDTYFEGTVEGVDANGALLVRDTAGQVQAFHSGEISLRPGT